MDILPTFYDIEQNSDEWYDLRLGMFSASPASVLFMEKKTKGYQNLITKIAFERVTGKTQKQFSNDWMEYGHITEPEASENYQIETFNELENGGLWIANEWMCASPDAKIIGQNAGCEFKCPSVSTYREYIEQYNKKTKVELPKDYFYQVHFQMLCTGWEYIDYMPYYSNSLKQLLTRVYRDEKTLDLIKEKINEAINDVNELIQIIQR
jgi:hypothetical protein